MAFPSALQGGGVGEVGFAARMRFIDTTGPGR